MVAPLNHKEIFAWRSGGLSKVDVGSLSSCTPSVFSSRNRVMSGFSAIEDVPTPAYPPMRIRSVIFEKPSPPLIMKGLANFVKSNPKPAVSPTEPNISKPSN